MRTAINTFPGRVKGARLALFLTAIEELVLGNERFSQDIEAVLGKRAEPQKWAGAKAWAG